MTSPYWGKKQKLHELSAKALGVLIKPYQNTLAKAVKLTSAKPYAVNLHDLCALQNETHKIIILFKFNSKKHFLE